VRGALRSFRRRALRIGIWVLVGVLLIASWVVVGRSSASTEDRIRRARGVKPGVVYQVDNMTAMLVDVADLGNRVGIHLSIGQPEGAAQRSTGLDLFELEFTSDLGVTVVYPEDARGYDAWLELMTPQDGRIQVDVHRRCTPLDANGRSTSGFCRILPPLKDPIGGFVIDFRSLHVPEAIWR
jgi:hypothetical protein